MWRRSLNRQEELNQILDKIVPINASALEEGVKVCDRLAKPLGALGKMEKNYAKLYAMFPNKIQLSKKIVMIYVADMEFVKKESPQILSKQPLL